MTQTLACAGAFVIALMIDFIYAKWLLAVNDQRVLAACVYSALCSLFGFLSLLACLDCWAAIVPSALGHAFGTYLALTIDAQLREAEAYMVNHESGPDDGSAEPTAG